MLGAAAAIQAPTFEMGARRPGASVVPDGRDPGSIPMPTSFLLLLLLLLLLPLLSRLLLLLLLCKPSDWAELLLRRAFCPALVMLPVKREILRTTLEKPSINCCG